MLVQKELKKLFKDLKTCNRGQFFLSGYDITVQVFDNSAKLSLSTPIYFGGNYIPKSVRHGVAKLPPFEKNHMIKTFLRIDEENYRIFLQYLGTTEAFNDSKFMNLLEDFHCLAEEWRIYLDEHDKNDLVYVRVKN